MKKLGCFLLLVFLLMSAPAFAGDLTLFGGLQRPGKITLRSAGQAATDFTFDPSNFGVIGLRVGIGKKVFGNESTFAYSSNFIDTKSKAVILNSNLIVQAPTPVAKPYVTAGLGSIITKGEGLTDIGSKFAINYGGGLKVTLAGPVGGRFDVRGYALPSVQSQTLHVLEVTLGVVFTF
jgi:hypothetical protein